jgi:mRNA-degrading endonuclease RelE of RelBE toxin-antitoxin system
MAKYKIVLRPTAEKDLQKLKKSGNAASIEIITTIFDDFNKLRMLSTFDFVQNSICLPFGSSFPNLP